MMLRCLFYLLRFIFAIAFILITPDDALLLYAIIAYACALLIHYDLR